jgi:hypothetical protein
MDIEKVAYRLIIEAIDGSQGRNIHPGGIAYRVSLLLAGMHFTLQERLTPAMMRAHEILREGK